MQFGGHCSRWCIVAKFQTLTAETCAYRLLGSAKPGHIELSDRSAAKKIDDGHQGKGCPRGVSTGLTLERRWKRNAVSRVSSVIVVIRLPISCVSSMAIIIIIFWPTSTKPVGN